MIKPVLKMLKIGDINKNPDNWKNHTAKQVRFFRSAVAESQYISPILVNLKTMNLIDGELRFQEAISRGEQMVECLCIDVEPEQEKKILMLLDKVQSEGKHDSDRYDKLLKEVIINNQKLSELLKKYRIQEYNVKPQLPLHPEMLVNYHYILLVFKKDVDYTKALSLFGIPPKVQVINSNQKGFSDVADGDQVIKKIKRVES